MPKSNQSKTVATVEEIVVNIKGHRIALTTEEAKKLKEALDKLFDVVIVEKIVKREEHRYHNYPVYVPGPVWINRPVIDTTPVITCRSGALLTYDDKHKSVDINC